MSGKKTKAAFDEQTLARVLEAAYVLQEHNRGWRPQQASPLEDSARPDTLEHSDAAAASIPRMAALETPARSTPAKPAASPDFTRVLSQIVETQQRIQAEHLDMEQALPLIAEQAMRIAQAEGAGIGILENGKVRYRAGAGTMALAVGSEVLMEKALCAACLRIGQVIRCGTVNLEFLVDADECARRGIESLIAAPVYQAGSVAGALELYYANPQSFTEPDVHACQLMAGLVGEVLARSEGLASKKSLAAERAAMREALEKLKPNLEALVEPNRAQEFSSAPSPPPAISPNPIPTHLVTSFCGKCGNALLPEEQFCGKCGIPRSSEQPQGSSMQSKVALLWQMQEEKNKTGSHNASNGTSHPAASAGPFGPFTPEDLSETGAPELHAPFAWPEHEGLFASKGESRANEGESASHIAEAHDALEAHDLFEEDRNESQAVETTHPVLSEAALVKVPPRPNWTSAAAAREFLERVSRQNRNNAVVRFLKMRRGDVYLALAIILAACVIRWGVWSDKPAMEPATPVAASHHSVYADLSFFDRMLIKLGLADPPDPPVYRGNPDTKVWVDVPTALYYCPGADLYGKTPKGKMTTQRDAQLDQFEPAYRKACN